MLFLLIETFFGLFDGDFNLFRISLSMLMLRFPVGDLKPLVSSLSSSSASFWIISMLKSGLEEFRTSSLGCPRSVVISSGLILSTRVSKNREKSYGIVIEVHGSSSSLRFKASSRSVCIETRKSKN
jgi:hypothetical protein